MSATARWVLPATWSWVAISEIADVTGGGTPSAKDPENFSDEEGVPWITPADLTGYDEPYISRGKRNLTEKGYLSSSAKLLPTGAVLFTSRAPIGYCAIAANPIATNQGFKSLVLRDSISSEYTRHYLTWSKPFLETLASGTTFLELSGSKLQQAPFPLPPLAEQKRIVARLDALSARSARARKELERIDALVTRYKQAVLAKAFSGELTKGWRHARGLPFGDSSPLVELCDSIADGDHQAPPKATAGVPFITISAMNTGEVDLSKATRFVPKEYYMALHQNRRARPGDVLYSVAGSYGIPALVNFDLPFVFQRHIAILRPKGGRLCSSYLAAMLASPQLKVSADEIATGTAQKTVPLKGLRQFRIPAARLEEQKEIVRRIESAFEKIDRLAGEAKRALALTDRLDAAILARAFRGELVPQDPTDEPASVLLERIKAARAAAPKPKRGRRATAQTG
ncbi:restriction endonuclease subunit S [Stappia sp.]|uniref:restriction endonuclease subunit S n=1 Tax=Stappia sp. TaxID=1870903 RepID=UPI0032D8F353